MDKWMSRPPAPCHRTRRDEEKPGQPYFVEDHYIGEVMRGEDGLKIKPRVVPLVHSATWIQSICDAPGSPIKAMPVDEWQRFVVHANELEDQNAELELQLDEARAEIASLRSIDGLIDTDALVTTLSEHFARKTGPKKA